jgi:hypothetical protein
VSRRPVDEECDSAHDLRNFEHVVKMELRPEVASDQQQFPEAWGVISNAEWFAIANTEDAAQLQRYYGKTEAVVRLIPQPEVDRLVREAEQRGRDAERFSNHLDEATRIVATWPKWKQEALALWINSGEQPGEGAK